MVNDLDIQEVVSSIGNDVLLIQIDVVCLILKRIGLISSPIIESRGIKKRWY